jgi:RNA polymerase sigma-70 factor (ECF subfamily)
MAYCGASCLESVPAAPCTGCECLVEHAPRGEAEAQDLLFRLLAPAVMQQAHRVCGPQRIAQGLAQAALVLILEHLPELRRPIGLGAWARSIVTNAWRMEPRSRAARSQKEAQPPDGTAWPSSSEPALEAKRVLWRALDAAPQLPPLLAETFRLRMLEGLSTSQAALRMEVSQEAVRARLARARKRLKAHLSGLP